MTEIQPAWAAIVVNYESGTLLLDAVRSLRAETSAGPVDVVVVDNGSRDGSAAAVAREFPDVRVVTAPGNVGYARAANLGIASTRCAIVAVFNSDMTIEPGTAKAMLARFDDDPQLGACGPRIRNLDGTDYPSARRMPSTPLAIGHGVFGIWWPSNPFTARYRELDADPGRPRMVDWVSGAAVWLRRDALDAVGGWDERYFMYCEDLDLCWRVRGAGWTIAYEPDGVVVHVQGAATSRRPYRMLFEHHRSAWRFARRRFTGLKAVILPFVSVYFGLRFVLAASDQAWRASKSARGRE
ncbi:MAG TPA: glycosyltransferase family 2 protein [Acidimicrobiia bacterium]|nr:glycosyltransferase family 2 protein [Acidimicrobiia bacterium]